MGRGIAEVFLMAGAEVTLYDPDPSTQPRLAPLIGKYRSQLYFHTTLPERFNASFIIEAIPENFDLKRELFSQIADRLLPEAIVATNTSALSVHALGAGLPYQERFLGWHFFNPAPRMPLVEVIPTSFSSPAAVERSMEVLQKVGKVPILAPDTPGFIVNRIARPYYVEALRLVESGAISPDTIDRLMEGLGFRMGPFRLMDLIGIDVNHAVTQRVWEGLFYPTRFRPSWLQAQKVAAGHLGRKTGKGFYTYDSEK